MYTVFSLPEGIGLHFGETDPLLLLELMSDDPQFEGLYELETAEDIAVYEYEYEDEGIWHNLLVGY